MGAILLVMFVGFAIVDSVVFHITNSGQLLTYSWIETMFMGLLAVGMLEGKKPKSKN